MLADTAIAIPALTDICRKRVSSDGALKKRIAERADAVKRMHDAQHKKWAEEAKQDWDPRPITLPRLASEVWDKIKNEDWVLTTNPFEDWATKLWDFDKSTAGLAARSARARRSAWRPASRWRTREPAGWWSTARPTAT